MTGLALGLRGEGALFDGAALRVSAYRSWLAGGVLAIVALVALAWFALISPQQVATAEVRAQTEDARLQILSLQRRLDDVRTQNANLDEYRRAYATAREALPTVNEVPTFLRSAQDTADKTRTDLRGFVVGSPQEVNGTGATIYALPFTVSVGGTADTVERFLQGLQRVQPRAVLVSQVTLVPDGDGKSVADNVLLTLAFRAFMAPAAAATATAPPGTATASLTD